MGLLRAILGSVFLAVVLLFSALTGYHWYRGASAEDAARMTIDDARVAASCPHKPDRVRQFIQRSDLESFGVDLAERLGADWVEFVCSDRL